MGDDLLRELMVHVAHPAPLFTLAFAHRANLLGFLKVLATGVELAALCPLHSPIAEEPSAFGDDVHHGGHLHPQVYPHDALIGGWGLLPPPVRPARRPPCPPCACFGAAPASP